MPAAGRFPEYSGKPPPLKYYALIFQLAGRRLTTPAHTAINITPEVEAFNCIKPMAFDLLTASDYHPIR